MTKIDEIQAAIAADLSADWIAEETEFLRSAGLGRSVVGFGLNIADNGPAFKAATDSDLANLGHPPPTAVDWRGVDGGRVTPVRFQGTCGSCVAFAVCAAMESAIWIEHGEQLHLSEGHLFFCNGGSCVDGWDFGPALEAARTVGVGLDADFPYDPSGACKRIPTRAKVTDWLVHRTTVARKRALAKGPVIGGLKVYSDLLAYRSGIYRHVTGTFEGNHAVCLVGYSDNDQCWIAKNSWSPRFGESGFFRIAYGQCDIDVNPFYSVRCASSSTAAG